MQLRRTTAPRGGGTRARTIAVAPRGPGHRRTVVLPSARARAMGFALPSASGQLRACTRAAPLRWLARTHVGRFDDDDVGATGSPGLGVGETYRGRREARFKNVDDGWCYARRLLLAVQRPLS
jgi:hypothetical protein